jgi:hypothetical protein
MKTYTMNLSQYQVDAHGSLVKSSQASPRSRRSSRLPKLRIYPSSFSRTPSTASLMTLKIQADLPTRHDMKLIAAGVILGLIIIPIVAILAAAFS